MTDATRLFKTGPLLFSFTSFQSWVNQAQKVWKRHGVSSSNTICIDQQGRVCNVGSHFMTARDDGSFPIDVYLLREDMTK